MLDAAEAVGDPMLGPVSDEQHPDLADRLSTVGANLANIGSRGVTGAPGFPVGSPDRPGDQVL